ELEAAILQRLDDRGGQRIAAPGNACDGGLGVSEGVGGKAGECVLVGRRLSLRPWTCGNQHQPKRQHQRQSAAADHTHQINPRQNGSFLAISCETCCRTWEAAASRLPLSLWNTASYH